MNSALNLAHSFPAQSSLGRDGRKAASRRGRRTEHFIYLPKLSQGPEQKGTVTNELTPLEGMSTAVRGQDRGREGD